MSYAAPIKNHGSTPTDHNKYMEVEPDFSDFDVPGADSVGGDSFGLGEGKGDLGSLESKNGTRTNSTDPWSLDNLGESEQEAGGLKDQVKELLKNPNLTPEQKRQLEKMKTTLSLSVDPQKAEETLSDQFETLKEQIDQVSVHGEGALRFAQALGMDDIGAAAAILDKYGIDADSKNIDMEKMKKLLLDPEVAGYFADKQEATKGAQKTLNDKVAPQYEAAHAANQATDQKDSSKFMDVDPAPFKWLADTANGESQECKDLIEAGNACSQKMADFISQVFKVDSVVDPKKPGTLTIAGVGTLNAVDPSLGLPAVKFPEIDPIEFHADLEGDGMTTVPEWMKSGHYPIHCTDSGGLNIAMISAMGGLGAAMSATPVTAAAYAGVVGGVAGSGGFEYTPDAGYNIVS